MSDDQRDRRPFFGIGDRVEVTLPGQFNGQQGTIRSVAAVQSYGGYIATYNYTVRLDNLVIGDFMEEHLGLPQDASWAEDEKDMNRIQREWGAYDRDPPGS